MKLRIVSVFVFSFFMFAAIPVLFSAGSEPMKIVGPNGEDITGTVNKLMEDNPNVAREFSRVFNEANKTAGAQGSSGTSTNASGTELSIRWTIKIDQNGKAYMIDENNPETTQQFPIGGGSRMLNSCTMRKINSAGSNDGDSAMGSSGIVNLPNASNGFSSSGLLNNGNNQGANSSAGFGNNSGYSVTTSSNKVDVQVQDVTPPRLSVNIEALDGRSGSLLEIKDTVAHQPLVKIPADSNPNDFYKNNSISPYDFQALAAKGLLNPKQKTVSVQGTVFSYNGSFTEKKDNVTSLPDAEWQKVTFPVEPGQLTNVKGIFIPEDVRIKFSAAATDEDEDYDEIKAEEGKTLNPYNTSTNNIGNAYKDFMKAPKDPSSEPSYAVQPQNGTILFPGIKKDSLKWKIIEKTPTGEQDYAVPEDPKSPFSVLFRVADPITDENVNPEDARYFLIAEVADTNGNETSVKLPIWVTKVSTGYQTIEQKSNRSN
ncbi:MAG: hypothetical protein HQM10_05140 [Candidatus Riflebacteria bacterium]|nr:hypothetical protein [Candidatus Riflebacteria bacterium]